ncbi:Ribonuclease HI [Planctomycetes bacterium MalM25]|nr:Ribonuclease HI [Planctomycetes bacterium MalM25]
MQAARPRYVLIAEIEHADEGPQWRFALQAADASVTIAACDREPGADEDRLVLLAMVRGLEALDVSADVTVVTRSSSVLRGLTRGLAQWRNNHWRWERFGRLTPIRDADLWRRVDQAMRFHTVHCRSWRSENAARVGPPRPHFLRTADAPVREPACLVEGRADSPAMVIVRSARSRRRVRLSDPEPTTLSPAHAAAG